MWQVVELVFDMLHDEPSQWETLTIPRREDDNVMSWYLVMKANCKGCKEEKGNYVVFLLGGV